MNSAPGAGPPKQKKTETQNAGLLGSVWISPILLKTKNIVVK